MAEALHFELVTPAALAYSENVHMVVAPGAEGEFGVMAGHMNFVSTLKPGIVSIYSAENVVSEKLFITGGVAEINTETGCTILADEVIELKNLTRADVETRLAKVRAAADAAITEEQKENAASELKLAEALLSVVAG